MDFLLSFMMLLNMLPIASYLVVILTWLVMRGTKLMVLLTIFIHSCLMIILINGA